MEAKEIKYRKYIALQIIHALKKKGFSAKDVAEAVCVNKNTMTSITAGTRNYTIDHLTLIVDYLGVDLEFSTKKVDIYFNNFKNF